ncbi:MAG: DUF4232 domain-containing protein [Candidatus Pacebacteria bacterium]|nr:DUF4232 domain-containing protein [Candidatus Paceibacterota bacterium]
MGWFFLVLWSHYRQNCDTSCDADTDCVFVCGCGSINKEETCNTNGVLFDCVNVEVFCQSGKCAYGGNIRARNRPILLFWKTAPRKRRAVLLIKSDKINNIAKSKMENTIAATIMVFVTIAVGIMSYYAGNNDVNCSYPAFHPPTCSSQPKEIAACDPASLKAVVQFEGAAGNIYGRFAITNISAEACTVEGKNFVRVDYDADLAKNIDVVRAGLSSVQTYTLAPSASIWALIHMPNGPQCGSAINQVTTSYGYSIGAGKEVAFADSTGKSQFIIQACAAVTDRTQVRITNMSDQMPETGQGL